MKKLTWKEAERINRRNGMETWAEDGVKTYWASYNDESGTFCFDSKKERDEFVARHTNK